MKDDPDLFDYNVQERVNAFVAAALDQVRFGECSFFFNWFYVFVTCFLVSAGQHYSNKSHHVHHGNRFQVPVCSHLV